MDSISFELQHLLPPCWLTFRQSPENVGSAYLFSFAGICGDGDAGLWKWRSLLLICQERLGTGQGDDAIYVDRHHQLAMAKALTTTVLPQHLQMMFLICRNCRTRRRRGYRMARWS